MSKSIAQKKSAKKKRGERSYKGRTRESGYTRSRAQHVATGSRYRGVTRMLIRNSPTEVVAWEVGPWTREGDRERTTLDVKFACGCTAHREAVIAYATGERERLMERAVKGEAIFEDLRERHDASRAEMLRAAQREFAAKLPPHTEHFAR